AQGNVLLEANSFFGPRGIDTTRMNEVDTSGGSPFRTLTVFEPELNSALGACAEGWVDPNTAPNFCASIGFEPQSTPETSPLMAILLLSGYLWVSQLLNRKVASQK
ncbi:MAG: hypothetical protein AB4058_04815, partial [Microcystaceae cyanobacterium]